MARKDSKDAGHHHFFSLRGKKKQKESSLKKGLGEALGAIGLRPEEDGKCGSRTQIPIPSPSPSPTRCQTPYMCVSASVYESLWTDNNFVRSRHTASSISSNSSAHGSLKHLPSRDSLKSIDMSLFNHLKRGKHDKSSRSSSRSASVEPQHNIPRIVTTTDAPSIVSRELVKPKSQQQMSRTAVQQDRSVSGSSSAATESTIAAEDSHHNNGSGGGILERAKSAIMSRTASPSPSASGRQLGPRGNHIVTDAVNIYRPRLLADLAGSKQAELAAGISSENLFTFIANERLRRMPARGSRWDKILKWSEDFAKKLALFEVTEDSFIPSSKQAVELILASIQLLLMVSLDFPFPAVKLHVGWIPVGNHHVGCTSCARLLSSSTGGRRQQDPQNCIPRESLHEQLRPSLLTRLPHDSSAHRMARLWNGPSASTTSTALSSTFTSVILACLSPSRRLGGT